ncbi:MAG TPA: hypothetical protein DIW23_06865 [Anaerolineae bacterium]|nr:hypothetical protein [Anaerolineae bacterium]
MPLDINLSPLYRIGGQEDANMPGVLALNPPKNAARGRETDRLIVYLLLAGNSTFTTTEYKKIAEDAAQVYYQTPRATTSALKASADFVNKTLLEKNMSTSASGKYALGYLLLASFRESQCIFSISGPMQAYVFNQHETKHVFEPSVSGKGLGSSQNIHIHFAQADLNVGDLLLLCGKVPNAWSTALKDAKISSLDTMRRKLTTITHDDLNALLIQSGIGSGVIHFGTSKPQDETPPLDSTANLPQPAEKESTPAHVLQPSAYAIPAQEKVEIPKQTLPREFPASIPRAKPKEDLEPAESNIPEVKEAQEPISEPVIVESSPQLEVPREPSERTRQTAKAIVTGMQSARKLSASLGERFRNFLPRLLPDPNVDENSTVSSNTLMLFMAIVIPLIVVILASVVYLRYGRNEQYDTYLNQAQQFRAQALAQTNPVEQKLSWRNVLENIRRAEEHRETTETINLKNEANTSLDLLLGVTRMQFNPAFSVKPGFQISRMSASENALYLLNAEQGNVLRAVPSVGGGGFEIDTNFNCRPGTYGNFTVGPLVDIVALPTIGLIDATLLGIDASGNLLYCKTSKVEEVIPLPVPDTNWGRVTAFALDSGNLYVLDAQSRAVWVYAGRDYTFSEPPYFFFGQQTPTQDVIDFIISGDDMYLLHGDGRLSSCSYSRIDTSASSCKDPLPLVNPFPAYQNEDLFGEAHFTQLIFAAPPDPSLLLLDTERQSLMRFAPRSVELQNQFRPTLGRGNPIPAGSVSAVAVSPDHVLYFAVDGQVYFAVNMP